MSIRSEAPFTSNERYGETNRVMVRRYEIWRGASVQCSARAFCCLYTLVHVSRERSNGEIQSTSSLCSKARVPICRSPVPPVELVAVKTVFLGFLSMFLHSKSLSLNLGGIPCISRVASSQSS